MQVKQFKEIWKPIGEFSGEYCVSNRGRIKSNKNGSNTYIGKIRKISLDKFGYPQCSFYFRKRIIVRKVHTFVAREFIGKKKLGFEVNHKDGNKINNSVLNLEYVSKSYNHFHRSRILKQFIGEKSCGAKLKEIHIFKIREMIRKKVPQKTICEKFSISRSNIWHIKTRKTWDHIK